MRRVSLNAPEGMGEKIANIAVECGVSEVTVHKAASYKAGKPAEISDVVQFDTATPIAKDFTDRITSASFYDPKTISVSIRQPMSVLGSKQPFGITVPIIIPSADIYEELWQFSHVTYSSVIRIFIAALLLSLGIIHDHLLLIISGLLFLPMQTTLLAIAMGCCTREWRLLGQGLYATSVAIALTIGAGAAVAAATAHPLQFQAFSSPRTSFLISIIIGIAAALASADDTGRRELIGLAVTAQVTVLPSWFGISLISGFPEGNITRERILTFFMTVSLIVVSAGFTYLLAGIRKEGIKRFASCTLGKCPEGIEPPASRFAHQEP